MTGELPKNKPEAPQPASGGSDTVPRSGAGADTALFAMLKRRQMRAGAEPQPAQPDGRRPRKK